MYAPPSNSQDKFEHLLNEEKQDAVDWRPLAVAGDCNAWAPEWGSRENNRRGEIFLRVSAALAHTLQINLTKTTLIAMMEGKVVLVGCPEHMLSQLVSSVSNACDEK